jgi:hypothetical protein
MAEKQIKIGELGNEIKGGSIKIMFDISGRVNYRIICRKYTKLLKKGETVLFTLNINDNIYLVFCSEMKQGR